MSSILMYMGIVQTSYSTSFFTPTILNQMGYKALTAQLMSMPIFAAATVCALITAFFTDRLKHRFGFIVFGCCVATVGFSILLSMRHVPVGARYFALFTITCGAYIAQPVAIVWLNNNLGGHYKRGVGAAMQIGIGNVGGIIAVSSSVLRFPFLHHAIVNQNNTFDHDTNFSISSL